MKYETYEALQAELDRVEKARGRAFKRGMLLGCALTILGFFIGFSTGGGL